MVALPDATEASAFLLAQELPGGGEAVALRLVELDMETTRGRLLGVGPL